MSRRCCNRGTLMGMGKYFEEEIEIVSTYNNVLSDPCPLKNLKLLCRLRWRVGWCEEILMSQF